MRDFTMFKIGDRVEVVNERDMWNIISSEKVKGVEGVVISVKVAFPIGSHPYDEFCDTPTFCIHRNTHPQILQVEFDSTRSIVSASGYWFDPIIKKRNAIDNSQGATKGQTI
jgi:hypothetical protein